MTTDLTRYVNLRYGVDNEGKTVIGPQRPNASVNPAPDTKGGQHSGYFTGNDIRGFSQIHASGTGYGKYGQFLLSPQIGLDTRRGRTCTISPASGTMKQLLRCRKARRSSSAPTICPRRTATFRLCASTGRNGTAPCSLMR